MNIKKISLMGLFLLSFLFSSCTNDDNSIKSKEETTETLSSKLPENEKEKTSDNDEKQKTINFQPKEYQSFTPSKDTTLNFEELNTGDVVGVHLSNPQYKTLSNNSKEKETTPYYFERTLEGLTLNVRPNLLTQPLKIYDAEGDLFKEIHPYKNHTFTKNSIIQEKAWPLIAVVVACCVEAEVGSNGWKVKFSCKCLKNKRII